MKNNTEFKTNIIFAFIMTSLFIIDYFVKPINILFCPLNKILGLPCPFCGSSRATLSILDLEFRTALSYNPSIYFILMLIILVIIAPLFKSRLKIPIIILGSIILLIYLYMMFFVYPNHDVFRLNEDAWLIRLYSLITN